MRFYGFFELALSKEDRELPDHLTVELEFMHYLALREGVATARGADCFPCRRAQADFVQRHPDSWLPMLKQMFSANQPPPFFSSLVDLTSHFLVADLMHLAGSQTK